MSILGKIHDQLDMTDGSKQLDTDRRRAPVNPHNYSLIIGLGGTGVDALVETKGLIQQCCEDSNSHVCYLGIDTSVTDLKNAKSSAATGKVGLEEHGEQCLLRSNGLGSLLEPAFIQTSYRTSPEIFDWIDERITPTDADTGAGGIRQIGRLIMTKRDNFFAVKEAIEEAVTNLARSATGDGSKLNVYIMAGISGGTGSGTFIDMAYLVRQILNEMPNFAQWGSIFGYLFMPDIHTAIMSQPYRRLLECNAYAALQELDYNLCIQHLQERYAIKWGTTTVVPGTMPEPIFNQVYLVSATDAAGHLLPNPRGTAVASVAQSILHFVADECPLDEDGFRYCAMSDYYSNIDNWIINYLTVNQRFPHRCASYLAIGSYDFQLPADDTRSIEEAIAEQLAPGQTTEDAWKELFRLLLAESRPLFYAKDPDAVGGTQTLISIPEICPDIYHYILKQAEQLGGITVQKTKLIGHIYAQTAQCGVTLANWRIVENTEKSFAVFRNMPGLHLVAPFGKYAPKNVVSWTEMSTLIPGYLRPEKGFMDENVRKLVKEEESKKAEIKNLCEVTETGIVSKSPAIEVVEDSYGICELCLIISNAKVVRSDGFDGAPQLEIRIGDDNEVFSADMPDAREKLVDILEHGFAECYKDNPAVNIRVERIRFRQQAAQTYEETLDYLTEQYITAIGSRHKFLNELAKYECILDFLQR